MDRDQAHHWENDRLTGDELHRSSQAADDNALPDEPALVPAPAGVWTGEDPIGSITSPSETGRYAMMLRDYAASVPIEGALVALTYEELRTDGVKVAKTVLCEAVNMRASNIHHEKGILAALLRSRGRIPGLSGFADNKIVTLLTMDAMIRSTDVHQMPRNLPPMGTGVHLASVEDVRQFSGNHATLYNIGTLYESQVPVGLILKHFGPGDDGWGDARMLGVFGTSGSGKSVMGGAIIAGFAARPEMGMLIIDPQGQYSSWELGKDPSKWSWRLDEAFRLANRGPDVEVVTLNHISLESPELFARLLARYKFLDAIGIQGAEKKERTVGELATWLHEVSKDERRQERTLGDVQFSETLLHTIVRMGAQTYVKPEEKEQEMHRAFDANPSKYRSAQRAWDRVREMFARPRRIQDLFDDILLNRKIIILNLEDEDDITDLYCTEILEGIRRKAGEISRVRQGEPHRGDQAGKYRNLQPNALIVIDEAHRFAPQSTGNGASDDQRRMLHTLQDAIKTTRKLGVGWCYITQSIANFNKDVFRQIQTKILGVGIGTGADEEHLATAFNNDKDLIARYRALPRPATTGVFPFAIIGELVALGNGSRALFVAALPSQQELFALNPEHFKYHDGKPVRQRGAPGRGTASSEKGPQADVFELPDDDDVPF